MKVIISIIVSEHELQEYQKDFFELNEEELSIEEAKQRYIDDFMADKNDYIDPDDIKVYFI